MKQSRKPVNAIKKVLSANDSGETGGHQAGILILKNPDILSFFPDLGNNEKNPRVHLIFIDDDVQKWEFAFIYYNNSFFGGTRNEYRLTRMTAYIIQNDLVEGDEVVLRREADGTRRITFRRATGQIRTHDGVLRIKPGWKVIQMDGGIR